MVEPFEQIELPYGLQVLWPAHCVQGSDGAGFAPGLDLPRAELVVRKGFRPMVDSYSAFTEADRRTPTGLAGYLRERGIARLEFVGLAHDFCVAWSAIDAERLGFTATVLEHATRAIDLNGSRATAQAAMRDAGVRLA